MKTPPFHIFIIVPNSLFGNGSIENGRHFFKNGINFIDYAWPWRLGRSWGALGTLLRRSWGVLKPSWDAFGRSWDTLGTSWDALGALLDASWGVLETSWETYRKKVEGDTVLGLILGSKMEAKINKNRTGKQMHFLIFFSPPSN